MDSQPILQKIQSEQDERRKLFKELLKEFGQESIEGPLYERRKAREAKKPKKHKSKKKIREVVDSAKRGRVFGSKKPTKLKKPVERISKFSDPGEKYIDPNSKLYMDFCRNHDEIIKTMVKIHNEFQKWKRYPTLKNSSLMREHYDEAVDQITMLINQVYQYLRIIRNRGRRGRPSATKEAINFSGGAVDIIKSFPTHLEFLENLGLTLEDVENSTFVQSDWFKKSVGDIEDEFNNSRPWPRDPKVNGKRKNKAKVKPIDADRTKD